MDFEMLLVFIILLATIALFVSDWLRLDVVALLALLALTLTGILPPAEAIAGFSDPIVLMIAGLFVVSGGLFRTGVASRIGQMLGRVAGGSRLRLTAMLMLASGVLSGFMSSTGTVAVMLPVAVTLAWQAGISPSKLLIPLSFASLLGGMLTLIGTPPNIVVANQLEAEGMEPFGFFDFTPIGVLMLLAGLAFMLGLGWRLLPERAPATGDLDAGEAPAISATELMAGYQVGELSVLRVRSTSPLIGRTPAEADLRRRYGVGVLRIRPRAMRGPLPRRGAAPSPVQSGDLLDVHGSPENLQRLQRELGLAPLDDPQHHSPLRMAEVLLTPRSRLIGRTLAEVRFRDRYGVHVMSIRRLGEVVERDLATLPLRFGDTLLVTGPSRRIDLLRQEPGDFVVVAHGRDETREARLSPRACLALAVMLGMMALLTFEVVPAVTAMATALEKDGWHATDRAAAGAARRLRSPSHGRRTVRHHQRAEPGHLQHRDHRAGRAHRLPDRSRNGCLSVSPAMTVAIAASTAFATPIASPVNTLVLGPGDYRFVEFFRIGVALQLLILGLALLIVPLLFPF